MNTKAAKFFWLGLLTIAACGWPMISSAQAPAKGGTPAKGEAVPGAETPKAVDDDNTPKDAVSGEPYVLRTYEVGDLIIHIEDHPFEGATTRSQGGGYGGGGGGFFSMPGEDGKVGHVQRVPGGMVAAASLGGSGIQNRFQLAQFGGGGGRGAGGPGAGGMEQGEGASANTSVTMQDIVRVLINTVNSESWAANGGQFGQVEPLGTSLVIWQTPSVHKQIGQLLSDLRDGAAERKTVTIDARWLLLTSDDLDTLVPGDQEGVPVVDRKKLSEFTRRDTSIRGITSCISSQMVYLVSGTMKNFVAGYIPVVGSTASPDTASRLANTQDRGIIRLVADGLGQPNLGGNSKSVGYQPIITTPNFGALLEIRPTLVPGKRAERTAIVDLKSTVTVPGDPNVETQGVAPPDGMTPTVDRLVMETQEFATTLRVPVGKPILVGGLTYKPSAQGSLAASGAPPEVGAPPDPNAAPSGEKPQLYLVLEVR